MTILRVDNIVKTFPCGCESRKVFDAFSGELLDSYRLPCCNHTTMICINNECKTCKDKRA